MLRNFISKKFFLMKVGLLAALMVCCAVALILFGCSQPQQLSTPENICISEKMILSWDVVDGADMYIVDINGKEREVEGNGLNVFDEIVEGTDYNILIKALSVDSGYADSDWAVFEYKLDFPQGLTLERSTSGSYYIIKDADPQFVTGNFTVPSSYKGIPIKEIDYFAFMNCTGLTAVSISPGIEKIKELAFSGCINIRTIRLGNGISEIEGGAFGDCMYATVVLPERIVRIGGRAFLNGTIYTSLDYDDVPDIWSIVDGNGVGRFWGGSSSIIYSCEIGYEDGYPYVISIPFDLVNEEYKEQHQILLPSDTTIDDAGFFTKDMPILYTKTIGIAMPVREGFNFLGWSVDPDATEADYPITLFLGTWVTFPDDEYMDCPLGTVFYAVYTPVTQ